MRWIIGDIHGMLRPLVAVIDAVRGLDRSPRFLFVGDYVNRGPDSRGVIDLLLTLDNASFVRGNHDDIFAQVLHDETFAPNATGANRIMAYQWFFQHGLDATFESYGADYAQLEHLARQPNFDRLHAMVELVPESHRRFIRTLPAVIEEEDLFVAHAKWPVDEPDDSPPIARRLAASAPLRHNMLWGRYGDAEIARTKAWRRVGAFGHTPVATYAVVRESGKLLPIVAHHMILLDTAAALGPTGRLTAFCFETGKAVQSDPRGQIVNTP